MFKLLKLYELLRWWEQRLVIRDVDYIIEICHFTSKFEFNNLHIQ